MSFAAPTAWLLIALSIPIIALYILKVRLRRIPVSTNLFWKQVYDEKPPRSLWQQLRHLLSLLAQLLLLLLLVLAIADPYFSWQPLQARRMVLVLDTSASMRAGDVAPSRFEAARKSAHQVLDGLRSRDQVAIVSAGSRPEVVLGMAGHVPTLRRAVNSIQPTDGTSSVDAAIELGKQLIGDHPHGQVLVLSDGCAERPPTVEATDLLASNPSDPQSPTGLNIESQPRKDVLQTKQAISVRHQVFATDAANVGVIQFQARRSFVAPIGYEILAKVRNASGAPVKARLELELDDVPVDVIPLSLKANEEWSRVIEKTSLEGGLLKASLTQITSEADDGNNAENTNSTENMSLNWLTTDDAAWAIVPPRLVQRVLIVSPGNLFLQKVFEANPLVQVMTTNEIPDQWPADTIVVCHRLVPTTLPTGQLLVVDPEASCDLWDLGAVIENPIVTEQDDASPLMTHIRLDNVLMPQARQLQFKSESTTLAATVTGESVYSIITRPQGDSLVLSVNLEQSDLAFRTAFPILATNALNWFAGLPGELQPSIPSGHMTSLAFAAVAVDASEPQESAAEGIVESPEPSPGSNDRMLVSPSQHPTRLLGNQIGPLTEVGVWSVVERLDSTLADSASSTEAEDHLLQLIAVNLANREESDLRPVEVADSTTNEPLLAGGWFSRPIWFYLIVVACLLSTLEWFLYQRRLIT